MIQRSTKIDIMPQRTKKTEAAMVWQPLFFDVKRKLQCVNVQSE